MSQLSVNHNTAALATCTQQTSELLQNMQPVSPAPAVYAPKTIQEIMAKMGLHPPGKG
ncbi:MAG: hypothetical protein JNL57_08685 [Bacteroidetes bacterium]|nr:hypothetical protein [Bacteroidota bacterium]